jgi:excisionase family DNA binding protein
MITDPTTWITRSEAMQILGCSSSTISRYIADGRLRPTTSARHPQRHLFRRSDVEALAHGPKEEP